MIPVITHRVLWPLPLWRSYVFRDDGTWAHVRYGWTADQAYARCLEAAL